MKENIVSSYVKSSFEELTKVTWPTKNQAVRLTVIVLIFCVVVALSLAAIDYLFSLLYTYILNLSS